MHLPPPYQLYAFISTNRKFECIECVRIPADALPTLPQKPQSPHKDPQPVIDRVSECATPPQVQPDTVSNAIEQLKISLVANFNDAFKSLETTLVQATSDARNDLQEKRLEALSLQLELAKKDKTHLERELGMARKAMRESKQQPNPENCQRCHALGDANKTAAENLRQSAQKQIDLETLVDSLRTDIAKANSELDSSKLNSDSLARNLNTAIESKHEAETKISELERRVRLQRQEVSDLNDQLHHASAKIAELEADLQNEQKKTAALNKRLRDQAPLPKASQNPSAPAPQHSPSQTAAQAFPPMDNQNPTAKTSQNHTVVDFLIIGNSNTSHIKPWRIFVQSKTTRVVTLENKTIEGATDFVDGCDLKPRVVVLQVAGNNLARSTSSVEDSVDKMKRLINNCQTKFPGASILVGQPLPRKLRTAKATELYQNKADEFTSQFSQYVIKLPTLSQVTPELFQKDGIHLTPRGVGRLVQSYKKAVSGLLGVEYDPSRRRQHLPKQDSNDNRKQYPKQDNAAAIQPSKLTGYWYLKCLRYWQTKFTIDTYFHQWICWLQCLATYIWLTEIDSMIPSMSCVLLRLGKKTKKH